MFDHVLQPSDFFSEEHSWNQLNNWKKNNPRLTPLSTMFHLYHGNQVYWWRMPEYRRKPPISCLPQVTDKLSGHNFKRDPHKNHHCQVWFSGFRDDLIVKVYDGRHVMAKAHMARWAKNYKLTKWAIFSFFIVSDWCLTPTQQFFSHIMARTS